MVKRKSLGKGLEALLTGLNEGHPNEITSDNGLRETLCYLPIEYLRSSVFQPRRNFAQDALQELADSIKAQGILQPLIVNKVSKNTYEIIAGERRWRAAQLAGLSEIPVLIKDIPPEAMLAAALIENIQREALNPLEEAAAMQRLVDEFDMTHADIAKSVGKARTSVSNALRLLHLHDAVKALIDEGLLEMGHARPLLSLEKNEQYKTAQQIIKEKLSVRETEKLVQRMLSKDKGSSKKQKTPNLDPDIKRLQNQLSEKLCAKVSIKHQSAHNCGKIIIDYYSLDELDGILERIP